MLLSRTFFGFQQRAVKDSRSLNNDTFLRLPVSSAQCLFGTEDYPDAGILLNYDDDADFSQDYAQVMEALGASTKHDILQSIISDDDFRSSNIKADDVCYNFYVFDIRYQQNFTASRTIKIDFSFDGVFLNNISGYALVLTIELVCISLDGQSYFHLI